MANSIQGELADFALSEYNANPQFIEGLIAKGEGELQAFLVKVLQNVHVGGLAGLILPQIENGIEQAAAQLIAAHSPQELYTLIGGWLSAEAKSLGG